LPAVRRLAWGLAALALLGLVGCGGGNSTTGTATGGSDAGGATAEAPPTGVSGATGASGDTGAAGATGTSSSEEVVAESEGDYPSAPPITKRLVREWPRRWCRVRIGDTREEAVIKMGAYPTSQNKPQIPLIPPVHRNAAGELVNEAPPAPYGVDTWEAPGSHRFNSFFDTDQRVQQLDFNGPPGKLPCDAIRVGNG